MLRLNVLACASRAVLPTALLLAGVGSAAAGLGAPVTVTLKPGVPMLPAGVKVEFLRVVSDDRCGVRVPGAKCATAGNAKVELRVSGNGIVAPNAVPNTATPATPVLVTLNTLEPPVSANLGSAIISVLGLAPPPGAKGLPEPVLYELTVKVEPTAAASSPARKIPQGMDSGAMAVGASKLLLGVKVQFLKVESDSRCPEKTTCVQAGNAVVSVRASGQGIATPMTVQLNTDAQPTSAVVGNWRLTLVSLAPRPNADGKPVTYQLNLRLDAVAATMSQ